MTLKPDVRPGERAFAAVLLVGLLAAAGAGLLLLGRGYFPVGAFNDDARYAAMAYRVARGQSLFHTDLHPDLELEDVPPGHPLLLAPFALLFPEPDALRTVPVLFALGAAWLFGTLAGRPLGFWSGVLVGTLFLWNPVTLTHGSTLLAEPTFSLLVALSLLAATGAQASWRGRDYALGLLLGFLPLVRPEGSLLALFLGGLLWKQRRRFPVRVLLGGAVCPMVYQILLRAHHGVGAHYGFLTDYYQREALWEAVPRAVWAAAASLGKGLLGLPSTLGQAAGALVLLLAVGALLRAARDGWPAARTAFLPLLAAQLLWPCPDTRYWIPIWPLLWLAVASAVREPRARIGLLLLVGAIATPNCLEVLKVSAQRAALGQERWRSYQWIREHSGPQDVIMSLIDDRVRLRARRPTISYPPTSRTLGDLLVTASRYRVRYILWEAATGLKKDVFKQPQAAQCRWVNLWLDASTLARRVAATPWDRVYQVEVEPGRYLAAHAHYRRALAAGDAREVGDELRRALRLVDDFPEARVALARHLLESGGDSQVSRRLLQSVHEQYPVYFEASRLLGELLEKQGQTQEALKVYGVALKRSGRLGAQEAESFYEQVRRLRAK